MIENRVKNGQICLKNKENWSKMNDKFGPMKIDQKLWKNVEFEPEYKKHCWKSLKIACNKSENNRQKNAENWTKNVKNVRKKLKIDLKHGKGSWKWSKIR